MSVSLIHYCVTSCQLPPHFMLTNTNKYTPIHPHTQSYTQRQPNTHTLRHTHTDLIHTAYPNMTDDRHRGQKLSDNNHKMQTYKRTGKLLQPGSPPGVRLQCQIFVSITITRTLIKARFDCGQEMCSLCSGKLLTPPNELKRSKYFSLL